MAGSRALTPSDLAYFPDDRPGITRRRAGRGWSDRAPDGTRIEQRAERRRLDALAVPPAYRAVWLCPSSRGHLQATGRDDRARKQYRYHVEWTAFRARRKFDGLDDFGAALPRIRRRIRSDLEGAVGDRDVAVAAILAMIDRLSLRVEHEAYARTNGSFGATTLRHRHVSLGSHGLDLVYPAKGGRRLRRRVRDDCLARVLHRLDDLPGARLVTWIDAAGETHDVTADEVNDRLARLTGDRDHTAKTSRPWNGSVAALDIALRDDPPAIKAMCEAAAARRGIPPPSRGKAISTPTSSPCATPLFPRAGSWPPMRPPATACAGPNACFCTFWRKDALQRDATRQYNGHGS